MKIAGIKFFNKKILKNKKGDILKYISKKDFFFKKFGEVYFSEIKKNKTKGWNLHKKCTCLLSAPYGNVKFTFIDGRKKSKTYNKKIISKINKKNYKIILVPAKIWFSFKSLSKISIVANCIEQPHSDKETLKSKKIKNIKIPD